MRLVKEYICDDRKPTDDEIFQAILIAENNDCMVRLMWYVPYYGWSQLMIDKNMTLEDCKEKLPRRYPV